MLRFFNSLFLTGRGRRVPTRRVRVRIPKFRALFLCVILKAKDLDGRSDGRRRLRKAFLDKQRESEFVAISNASEAKSSAQWNGQG
jgi:hypothetical protein